MVQEGTEKYRLAKAVEGFPARADERPQTFGPAPNRQTSQYPLTGAWAQNLFDHVKAFDGVQIGKSHISGDGGQRAFFLPDQTPRETPNRFLTGNEFAHIHDHESYSLHAILPLEIGETVFYKKWGEQHPLVKFNATTPNNYLLYGARNEQENEQLKILLRISYLYSSGSW